MDLESFSVRVPSVVRSKYNYVASVSRSRVHGGDLRLADGAALVSAAFCTVSMDSYCLLDNRVGVASHI